MHRIHLAAAALLVLSVAGCTSATASPSPTRSASGSGSGSASGSLETPGVTAVASLTGTAYYLADDFTKLVRVTKGTVTVVIPASGGLIAPAFSPDGRQLAVLSSSGTLRLYDADGGEGHTLATGLAKVGYEPSWSPDGTRILVAKPHGSAGQVTLGTVPVAGGAFTALPHQPSDVIHPMWLADGIVFATGECRIGTTDATGDHTRLVPVFGTSAAPQKARSCDPFNASPDGRLALQVRINDEPDGDIGPDYAANAILDPSTGALTHVQIPGDVEQIVFQVDGDAIVRTKNAGHLTLTRITPGGNTVSASPELPAVSGYALIDFR